jgi:putative transport protein
MTHHIVDLCRDYPQIVIFLAIAAGYFIGKIKIYGFTLGSTAGCLLAALVLGQIDVQVPGLVKTISFAFFIFCIGYKVGPQFFGALKKEGLNYIWVALVVAMVGLATAILLGKLFNFGPGTTAGLLAGAMTQSATIGTAEGAIKQLAVSGAEKITMEGNIAISYAITYIFGTAGLILAFKMIPRILKIDFRGEASNLEREMSGGEEELESPALFSWYKQLELRAYRVTKENVAGKTVKEVEALFPGKVAVDRIQRGDEVIDPSPDTVMQPEDIVSLVGYRAPFAKGDEIIGPEVDDRSVTDLIGEIMEICVMSKGVVGKSLGEISVAHGHGCFLKKITRQGHELPLTKDTVVSKCDVLTVAGAQKDVERLVQYLGYPERPTAATDLIFLGLGVVLGTLIGLLAVSIAGIPITLGVGGGVLVSGLLFGWLRAVHPTFGQIPAQAQWVFTDLGLNLFITCVGLAAGPRAVHALQTTGVSIFFAGVLVTLTPMIGGMVFGRVVLKMNHVLLYGALTGAETCTASLNAVKEEAGNAIPVLGYTVPYAFGNVLLTVWGTVIVNVM